MWRRRYICIYGSLHLERHTAGHAPHMGQSIVSSTRRMHSDSIQTMILRPNSEKASLCVCSSVFGCPPSVSLHQPNIRDVGERCRVVCAHNITRSSSRIASLPRSLSFTLSFFRCRQFCTLVINPRPAPSELGYTPNERASSLCAPRSFPLNSASCSPCSTSDPSRCACYASS